MNFMDKAREELQSDDPTARATILWSLSAGSEVPDDILAMISKLMEDHSAARMYIPFRYGEVRYIAAETYAKMLFHRGRVEPLVLPKAIVPRKLERLSRIREHAGLSPSTAPKGPLALFAELRDLGLLEIVDEVFDRSYFDMND
jgi:hypothetical protein